MKSARAAIPGIIASLLFLGLAFQVGSFILLHSNTVDELAYIGAGADYVHTGRIGIDIFEHPPLMKYLIGIALIPISQSYPSFSEAEKLGSYRFGFEFLYHHPNSSPELILASARLPSLMLSFILALFVFAWASRWYGECGGILALSAYCFEPNIITHSGLATMDLSLACFLFLATFFLVYWLEKPKPWALILSGVFAGCAVITKIPGLIFFLWAPCLCWFGVGHKKSPSKNRTMAYAKALLTVLLIVCAIVTLAYQARFLPYFIEMFRYRFQETFFPGASYPLPVFLHGTIRTNGWLGYFLLSFLTKTTIPFLLLCVWAIATGKLDWRKRVLVIPPVIFLFLGSIAAKQQGIRYLLPIYPFLCVLIGGLADVAKDRGKVAAVGVLIAWSMLECAFIYPHYLAYFNETIGGPSHGYEWFWDSNLDWGQDCAKMGNYLKDNGSPEVIVASPFNADRNHFLGTHQDLLGDSFGSMLDYSHINTLHPTRELLIISAVLLDGYALKKPDLFYWLRMRSPIAQIGYTTFVYDVTFDALTHYNIGWIYVSLRKRALAIREFQRAAQLSPGNPLPAKAMRQATMLFSQTKSGS